MSNEEIIAAKDAKIAWLEHRLAQLERLIFGSKSERVKTLDHSGQLELFAQTQAEQEAEQDQAEHTEQITYTRSKAQVKHLGRNPFPDHLPVKEIVLEPDCDTSEMTKINEQITQTLEYSPANLYIKRIIRPVYVDKQTDKIVTAELPPRPLPKAIAEASLLTLLIVSKFIDHLPFYRQQKMYLRDFNWEVSSSTINDWFIGVCNLLEPLYNKLKQKILESDYIQADESPIKVLQSDHKGKAHQGYQWVYHSPELGLLFFHYRKGRGENGPKEVLVNYKGYLQCDGYTVYDKIGKKEGIILVGCLVHVRRKYHEALNSDKQRARFALDLFRQIYHQETLAQDSEDKTAYRLEHIKPLLDQLKTWINEEANKVLPKSPIGRAMSYTLSQWPKLINIFLDGRLKLDNNLIENKIRPLALGRKNYMFAGNHESAQRIAMMYSFFGSCAANGINPTDWMNETLEKISDTKLSDLESLLPMKRT